jgi:hypothetical protein
MRTAVERSHELESRRWVMTDTFIHRAGSAKLVS